MSNVLTGMQRGDNLVGLQPDDRTPTDWLRMVARVFTAYRKTPLESSIVAYIDGFKLTPARQTAANAIIEISPGQSFVDDQFIGFTEKTTLTIDAGAMLAGTYYIVLCYTWVNSMPPQTPTFDIISTVDYNADPSNLEHMLILGTLDTDAADVVIIDDKIPWIEERLGDYMTLPKQYFFIAPNNGVNTFTCIYNIDYVSVSVNGIELFYNEFTATDGQNITVTDLETDDEVIIRTTLVTGTP